VESVVWGKYATPEQTIVLGIEMAEAKRLAKLEADPDISPDRLPYYAGYLQAEVGLIRANAYLGVATLPGERRCIPDLFEVVHLPENGVHVVLFFSVFLCVFCLEKKGGSPPPAHVVLSENYVDAIKVQMTLDGSPGAENITKKLAFPVAINMLLATLELSGFFCHNGDHIPCSAIV